MKKSRLCIKAALIIIISIFLGVVLLTISYCLPNTPIRNNVISSAETIQSEGLYPSIFSWCTSYLDNYTDSLMLNTAAYNGTLPPVVEAMKAHRYYYSYQMPDTELINYYIKGLQYDYVDSYTRYWHGYQAVLKPLLTFTDLNGIRIINSIFHLSLVITLIVLLRKKSLKHLIAPFLISYLLIMPVAIAMSIQYSQCFFVLMVSSIMTVTCIGREEYDDIFLLIILISGIVTSYLDLLTYPLVTFGVPFLFYISEKRFCSCKDFLLSFIKCGIFWCVGYALMWVGKWVVGTIITNENLFTLAIHQAQSWTKSSDIAYMLYNNIRDFAYTPFMILAVIYCFINLVKIAKSKTIIKVSDVIPFIIISLLPLLWYLAIPSHSSVHHFYTNKILMITALSIMCMLSTINAKTPSE